jgi:hypothetical protein
MSVGLQGLSLVDTSVFFALLWVFNAQRKLAQMTAVSY